MFTSTNSTDYCFLIDRSFLQCNVFSTRTEWNDSTTFLYVIRFYPFSHHKIIFCSFGWVFSLPNDTKMTVEPFVAAPRNDKLIQISLSCFWALLWGIQAQLSSDTMIKFMKRRKWIIIIVHWSISVLLHYNYLQIQWLFS